METTSSTAGPLTDEWCAHQFDYLAPEFGVDPHEPLARMRSKCPVTHSDLYGGYWVLSRYDDVLRIAQDWETFSSAHSVTIPATDSVVRAIPEEVDPPLHRVYKRLINAFFTPAWVAQYEQPTRNLITGLIDDFIEDGRCDLMSSLARPFPGLAFFELVLNAPSNNLSELARMSSAASIPTHPDARTSWEGMFKWITDFVADRRAQPPKGDIVDAILAADIEGRPITDEEIIGIIQLIILGGLETTSGALGQFVIRFAHEPQIPALLRRQPELIPQAIEELLRLEPPFIGIGRTAMRDTEIDGRQIRAGEKVLIYYASANRDDSEFDRPDTFDPSRKSNRHLSFGAGPHRCAGSNLARLNLQIAVEEVVNRLDNIQMQDGMEPLEFHCALNRAPLTVPITFTPGPRIGSPAA
jgi:cytochrome P450